MKTFPTTCVRHWERPAVGLFTVMTNAFAIKSWMCEECARKRAPQSELRRLRES